MSELENKIPQEQQSDGTVLGAMFYLGGVLLFLVSFLSILSQVTGWKLSMKGVPIPAGWGFAGIFSALALASFGTGWVYNLPSVQRVFRNHKWIWFPLLGGIVAFFWGLVVVINILDAGGLLMYAVNQGNVKKVEGYLKNNKVSNETKVKILQRAVSKKQTAVVKLLLHNGADPNTKAREWRKKPLNNLAFHQACASGGLEMVKAFLNKGVTLNALNKRGESPLYYAVIKSWSRRPAEQRQVVQLLLKKGAIFKGKLSNYKQRMLRRDYPRLFRKILSTSEASSAPGAKAPAKPPAFLDLKKKRSPGGDAKTSKELDRDENDRDDDDNDDDDDDGKEEPKPSAKKKKKKKRGQNFLDE